MKKIPVALILLNLLSIPVAMVLMQSSALAKSPECYTVRRNKEPPLVKKYNCENQPAFLNAAKGQLGEQSLKPDNCYILGITPTVIKAPLTNTFCVNAKRQAKSNQPQGNSNTNNATNRSGPGSTIKTGQLQPASGNGKNCGDDDRRVTVSINIGCRGEDNPIVDMLFAVIRFLSVGVGVVVVGSIILGGLQYIASAGKPEATAKAISRIVNSVIALLIYFLIFAILNWIVPSGIF